jgi:hypothetical protein
MSGTDQALLVAEGNRDAACLPNSNFSIAFFECEVCLSLLATYSKTEELASLNGILSFCNDTGARASLCSVNNITSDCPTTSSRNVTVAMISSKPAAVSTLVAASSAASTLPLKSAGAIAGVAVACTLAVVVIIALVIFLCFRRRKRHKQDKIRKVETANRQEVEKAQLHSEDLKPIRKELSGDQPLASKKDISIAEMPANEDPQRTTSEMPANEAVGNELQGGSNEERNK